MIALIHLLSSAIEPTATPASPAGPVGVAAVSNERFVKNA